MKTIIIEDEINSINTLKDKIAEFCEDVDIRANACITREAIKIGIPTMKGYTFIHINDILRCEANGRYTLIYTEGAKKIISSKNLGEYEAMLLPHRFFRAHRSQLVNLNKVKEYLKGKNPSLVLNDDSQVMVVHSKKEQLLKVLGLK